MHSNWLGRLVAVACLAGIGAMPAGFVTPAAAPAASTGAAGSDQAAPDPCGGRSNTPEVACPNDVRRMLTALPEKAYAAPAKPRRVLVLGNVQGWAHSSRPLAAATVAEMGKKTGAWSADITYDPSTIDADNLKQYDAIFLNSTTGTFLDDPGDKAATAARRTALMDFVRGGKGLAAIHAATDSYHGGGRDNGGDPLWPEFNRMIGAYFKWHWNHPTPITVKIDDPKSPLTQMFSGPFNIADEVYTFNQESFSRDNVHVLTSIDYSMMSAADKQKESNPRSDHDYALSWIKQEGQGRVFYMALGHHESIYYDNPHMLQHLLAGIQYALGDLKADATPAPTRR